MPHLHARPLTRSFISGIVALAAVLLVGGGVAVAATRTVTISDFAFSPRTLTINVGDTVRWRNSDPVAHTATATGGAFDTGNIDQGESRTVRFTVAGTYRYICTPHPTMTGTIRVRAASGGSGLPATDTIVSLSPDEQRVDAGAGPAMIAAGATLLVALVIARRRRTA
jgi:plastocyanin